MNMCFVAPFLLIATLFSCNKNEMADLSETITWETNVCDEKVTRTIKTYQVAFAELSMVRNTDCEFAPVAISLSIRADEDLLYEQKVDVFPFREMINLPGNSHITIETIYNERVLKNWYCTKDPTISCEFKVN